MARITAAEGNLKQSIDILIECANESKYSGHVTAEAWARVSLSDLLHRAGQPNEAQAHLERAEMLATAIDSAALRTKIKKQRQAIG
jgi:hypothetical protein